MNANINSSTLSSLGALFFLAMTGLSWAADQPGEEATKDVCQFGKNGVITNAKEYQVYLLHQQSDLYRLYDKNCDGKLTLSANDWADYNKRQSDKNELALNDFNRQLASGKPFKIPQKTTGKSGETSPTTPSQAKETATKTCPPAGWHTSFVLRDSYTDVSSFSCPSDPKSASGAQFGWSRDAVADNRSWSTKGVVAESFTWWGSSREHTEGTFEPYLAAFSITPSIRFERLDNSSVKLKAKNTDVLVYGATTEAAIGHIFDDSLHLLRMRGTFVSNFEGDAKSWAATAEWQPITNQYALNLGAPNSLGALPITWEPDAIVRAEYSEAIGTDSDPIFDRRKNIFRVGGVVALALGVEKLDTIPTVLQHLGLNASYLWLEGTATGKPYLLFNGAAVYNLDDSGHFGIKLSYQKGKIEETAKLTNSTTISLTSKF